MALDNSKLLINRMNELPDKLEDLGVSIDTNVNQLNERINTSNTNLNTKIDESVSDINALITALTNRITTLEARRYVKTSYKSGTNWYRIWSDGWCEQGGQTTCGECTTKQITLLKTFNDTNYNVSAIQINQSTNGDTEMGIGIAKVNASNIRAFTHYINPNTTTFCWRACGFLASGQY